ncbi:MAG: hypothetical protein WC748_05365 [Legionellales bacterium]|jgi:hypothetical protein
MSITTASQAYAIHLLQIKIEELTGEVANLKNNIFNAVDVNIKQKKIGALNILIESFKKTLLIAMKNPKITIPELSMRLKKTTKKLIKP